MRERRHPGRDHAGRAAGSILRTLKRLAVRAGAVPVSSRPRASGDLTPMMMLAVHRIILCSWVVVSAGLACSGRVACATDAAPSIYLAARADGRDGSGTLEDPRDASTAAKLDALWPGLPRRATISFLEGTFQTAVGLELKEGQRILGRGTKKTTLKLADGAMPASEYSEATPLVRILLRSQTLAGNNHVRGLRIDGNREGQPAYTHRSANVFVGAIVFYGMNCSIRDVHYLNGFNHSEGEVFPILIETHQGMLTSPGRGVIERVTVDEHEGYNTAISLLAQTHASADVSASAATGIFSAASHRYADGAEVVFVRCGGGAGITEGRSYFARDVTPTTFRVAASPGGPAVALRSDLVASSFQPRRITGAIRNCVVRGRGEGAYSRTIGFGCGGWLRVTLRGNRTEGVAIGVNTDTHCYRDVRIVNNSFGVRADPRGNQAFGVFLGGGYSWTRYRIVGNTFLLSRNAAALVFNGHVRNVLFARNVVRVAPDGAGASESVSLRGEGNAGLRLVRNQVDARLHFSDQPGVVTVRRGNRALVVAPEASRR